MWLQMNSDQSENVGERESFRHTQKKSMRFSLLPLFFFLKLVRHRTHIRSYQYYRLINVFLFFQIFFPFLLFVCFSLNSVIICCFVWNFREAQTERKKLCFWNVLSFSSLYSIYAKRVFNSIAVQIGIHVFFSSSSDWISDRFITLGFCFNRWVLLFDLSCCCCCCCGDRVLGVDSLSLPQ